MEDPLGLRGIACVAHVHSTYSDGTATIPELAEAAAEAGVECVMLTDHDTLEAQRRGEEGWHGDVLILVGHEVSPKGGHLLVFGVDEEIGHAGRSEREILEAVRDAGGVAIAAHPFSEGSRMSKKIAPPHGWGLLDDEASPGVELWSLETDSAEAWRSPREAVAFLRDPMRFLDGPPPRHLAIWDELCRRRRVPAIGGLDAHQKGIRVRGRVRYSDAERALLRAPADARAARRGAEPGPGPGRRRDPRGARGRSVLPLLRGARAGSGLPVLGGGRGRDGSDGRAGGARPLGAASDPAANGRDPDRP